LGRDLAWRNFSLLNGLGDALKILNKLTEKPNRTNLTEFQNKFFERYQYKEVPLSEALDIETGIGYAQNTNYTGDLNPLIDNLILPYVKDQQTELIWNKKQSFLLNALLKAQQNKQYTVSINKEDIKEFKENWNDLPDSFSVLFKHLGKRNGEDLICIDHIGGSSATCILGRFALSNKKIEEIVTEIAESEKQLNPNAILAEISHLPESRTGNVLMRPVFRNYEIPYLSKSVLPKNQQITLDDLHISIRNNQLYLHSKRLNKQILPRLGNAHNYSFNSLPVYHFLCDMQTQNIRRNLFFSWGNLNTEFSFLPRIEVGNVIISSATWQLIRVQYQMLLEKNTNLYYTVSKWRKKWQLPNLILLAEGDNELLINLKDELSLKMFFSIIKKKSKIVLKEFLFDEKTAIIKDKKGNSFTNEFVASLQKQRTKEPILRTISYELTPFYPHKEKLTRNFSLGTEWLYYKLYCGVKIADRILTKVLKPLTEKLIKQHLIDNWFFIRYADPEIHLRIRFHFTDLNNIGTVIQLFQHSIAEYEQNGLIWKVQTDTYQREIERYGEKTIVLSEQLFYYDSKYIVNMLDMIDGDEGERIRWMFAIKSVDEFLSNFKYSFEQKMHLMENLKTSFAYEFNINKNLKMQIDKKFRIYRKTITEFIDSKNDPKSVLQPLFKLLKQKSVDIEQFVNKILAVHKNNELHLLLDDLLASYIHMLFNRLFKNKQRLHEMVVYDFMWRTYRSKLAKQQQLKQ
jgi:thiopeptide-type bacteriocin biosynthesis protein